MDVVFSITSQCKGVRVQLGSREGELRWERASRRERERKGGLVLAVRARGGEQEVVLKEDGVGSLGHTCTHVV